MGGPTLGEVAILERSSARRIGRPARWTRRVVGGALAAWLGVAAHAGDTRSLHLADLPAGELEALQKQGELPEDAAELLQRILDVAPAFRFDVGAVVIDTDRRWFATFPATQVNAPLIEVRRWPGDTLLAAYALRGSTPPEGYRPPVPGASLTRAAGSDTLEWSGTLETASGPRPVRWLERAVPAAAARLGLLLLPGDAGLGEGAVAALDRELRVVADRAQVRSEAWAELDREWVDGMLALPSAELAPRPRDEREDPWQIARGLDFTLGLPPGILARTVQPEFPGPRPLPGARMWLRGRFLNSDGEPVVVGDGRRAGYVADRELSEDWRRGKLAPLGAPRAELVAGHKFELAVEQTRAVEARAERWKESGFAGEWLLFRLVLAQRGVEIGLPILAGRRSEALFWIPVTWREIDQSPAPPPIDPAKRFGIRFDRLARSDRKYNPWTEGYLSVPGLRLELPAGWWPVARLRSRDGFPVRLLDSKTRTVAWLERLAAGSELLARPEERGWQALSRPGRYHAAAVYGREDGARLFVAREGHAFLLRKAPQDEAALPEPTAWERLVESALLLRVKS